jgi:peptidoglycan/xylan/chitin deacetylase (PgdA/CDA1 family)
MLAMGISAALRQGMEYHCMPPAQQGDKHKALCYKVTIGIGLLILCTWLTLGSGILLIHADGPRGKPSETGRGPTIAQGGGTEPAAGLVDWVNNREPMLGLHPYLSPHPNRPAGRNLLSLSALRQALCFTSGDDGPGFSTADLAHYTPPPPRPNSKITPPVWTQYPGLLQDWPLDTHSYPTETITYLAEHEVHYGDRQSAYLALTFDCENETGATRKILETLRNENTHATFFLTGRYAYMWPELARQIVEDGHEIGNHSFFHPLFTSISPLTATLEITYTEAAIARAVGSEVPMRFFRFPYAGRNNATRVHVAALGYQSAFWDLDTRGWEPGKTPEDVVAYMRRTAHSGGIVIMHCHSWNDAYALVGVIRAIRDKGLTPGTLSDVLTEADRAVPGYPSGRR